VKEVYILPSNSDYISLLDETAVIMTNIFHDGIYGGSFYNSPQRFFVYSYDYESILQKGAAAYAHVDPSSGFTTDDDIAIKILLPARLQGMDFKLKIGFDVIIGSNDLGCYKALAYLENTDDSENSEIIEMMVDNFEFPVSPARVQDGKIVLVVNFPNYYTGLDDGGNDMRNACSYRINKVEFI
jgi:hypothetical protein